MPQCKDVGVVLFKTLIKCERVEGHKVFPRGHEAVLQAYLNDEDCTKIHVKVTWD